MGIESIFNIQEQPKTTNELETLQDHFKRSFYKTFFWRVGMHLLAILFLLISFAIVNTFIPFQEEFPEKLFQTVEIVAYSLAALSIGLHIYFFYILRKSMLQQFKPSKLENTSEIIDWSKTDPIIVAYKNAVDAQGRLLVVGEYNAMKERVEKPKKTGYEQTITFDWKKELRLTIGITVLLLLTAGILLGAICIYSGYKSLSALTVYLATTILAFFAVHIGDLRTINTDKYKELQDKANDLAEKGRPEFKEEIKRLLETSGKIKGYQYEHFKYLFASVGPMENVIRGDA